MLRAYLKTGDMPDPEWSKDDIVHMYNLAMDERDAANESLAALHRENALQGLHLATMADVVLGENSNDRSDDTLVREVCRMAREYAELMPIVEAAKAYVDYDIEGEPFGWPDSNRKFEALKAAVEARKEQP